MILVLTLLATSLATPDALAPRLDTLKFHVERLGAITVPADLEDEKQAKLAELKAAVEAGVADQAAFDDLYRKIDVVRVWLWAHSVEKPQRAPGSVEETPEAWVVRTPQLELTLRKSDLGMTVKTAAETWDFAPCDGNDVEANGKTFSLTTAGTRSAEVFAPGYAVGGILHLADFPDAPGLAFDITISLIGNEIVFDIAAPSDNVDLGILNWPKPLIVENTAAVQSFFPRMQGILVPGDWPQEIHEKDLCNSRTLYMPWWGQVRNGHGVQTILETSMDAGAAYDHPAGGPTVVQPRWYSSLKRVRYLRTARYVFDDNATYVTMAKRYRRWVKENGQFVSLDEKLVRTPNLAEVIGRPVVHLGALYHFVEDAALFNKTQIEANHSLQTFDQLSENLRQLKAKGIDDAYVHLDGWGFMGYDSNHPDPLPVGEEQGGWDGLRRFADTCDELGYLFATHDQYRDFYLNAVSFDDRLSKRNADGTYPKDSTWPGGKQQFLSARFAPEYVRRNHDLFAEHGVKVRGAYLDVFSVVPPEESFEPAHPVTRAECAEYRRQCFDLLRARGYVVSSEEPTDYLARSLDLVHHGPYPVRGGNGEGVAVGVPIPLFNLVYHDSILLPWSMTEDGGWGIPKGDAGRLHCLLNAGLPYVDAGVSPEGIAFVKEAMALSQRCARQEMLNHEFLTPDRRQQRTTFADGTVVTVNLDTREYRVEGKQ
ncbi:MAG: DUF5696 domain-containing protein [FCB group bacterium]|jgi:hypothetical protein|nr:DUF5696 domain-containing protein [FCB group bacterium]